MISDEIVSSGQAQPHSWKRNAIVFLGSQSLSLLGSALVQYAILWKLALDTQSGLTMTVYTICGFLPAFFLSPFAGVWADRYERKRLIMLSDGTIAFVTLIMLIAFLNGQESMTLLLVIAVIRSIGSAVQMPAVGALLPQIVPQHALTRVNGINGTLQSGVSLGAPLLSGALLTGFSIETIFMIDIVTAGIAISLLLFFLRIRKHAKATQVQQTSYFQDMREGLSYIRGHRYLLAFFIYIAVFMLLATPSAMLTTLQTVRSFGADVWRLTAIEMAFSVGMLLGGAAITTWGGFPNRLHTMLLANLFMAVCAIGLGFTGYLSGYFILYLGFMSFFGLAMPFFNTPSMVMLQEHVEEAFLGRVFSMLTMITTSVMPLGMVAFGPLADYVSIESILIVTGTAMLLQAVLTLRNRRLVEAGTVSPASAAQSQE